jgi:hypothetical protein
MPYGPPTASTPTLASLGIAKGVATNSSAALTVVTGLGVLSSVTLSYGQVGAIGSGHVSVIADLGDQAGAPAAGSFILRTYDDDALANDPSASSGLKLNKKINWIAIGAPAS